METSALEATNVENAFAEVLTQIYHIVSRKAVEASDEGAPSSVPPKGETINIKDEGSSWKRLDAVQARACMEIFKDNGSCCISLVHYIVQPAILFI